MAERVVEGKGRLLVVKTKLCGMLNQAKGLIKDNLFENAILPFI